MNGLVLTTQRAARIFEDMVSCRRDYCADDENFKMTDVWKYLCEGSAEWKIKLFRRGQKDLDRPQAAVAELNHNVRLTVSEELWADADRVDELSNFILAHEIGHLELKHNSRFATRHFQMASGIEGYSILPKSYYELEADFAAVVFQCGVALLDFQLSAVELANRAFCDVEQVRNAQRMVQLGIFRRELARPRPVYPRVVL